MIIDLKDIARKYDNFKIIVINTELSIDFKIYKNGNKY